MGQNSVRWMRTLLTLCFWTDPARACELALLFALDVSGSVDPAEYRLQRDGLAAALSEPAIADALAGHGAHVSVLQWSGQGRQGVTVPWRSIESPADALAVAAEVAADARLWRNFSTAVGEALEAAADAFESGPDCTRRVIDISGDGRSNEGPAPRALRPRLLAEGITVNALVIRSAEPFLVEWFVGEVLTGPGAFAMEAGGYSDYPRAILAKLEREVVRPLAAAAP